MEEENTLIRTSLLDSSAVKLWFILIPTFFWVSFCASSGSITNHYSSILLVPMFIGSLIEFRTGTRKTRVDQVVGAIAFGIHGFLMILNIIEVTFIALSGFEGY